MGKTSAAAAGGYDDEETCHYDYEQGQIPRRVSRNDDEDISAMGSRTSNNENGGGSRIPDHIDQYAYGHGYGTSTLGAHRYTPTSSAFAVAASANTPPSAYHGHGRDDRAAGQKYRGRARGEWGGCSGGRNEDDTIPPFVQVDTEIVRSKDPLLEYSRPRGMCIFLSQSQPCLLCISLTHDLLPTLAQSLIFFGPIPPTTLLFQTQTTTTMVDSRQATTIQPPTMFCSPPPKCSCKGFPHKKRMSYFINFFPVRLVAVLLDLSLKTHHEQELVHPRAVLTSRNYPRKRWICSTSKVAYTIPTPKARGTG